MISTVLFIVFFVLACLPEAAPADSPWRKGSRILLLILIGLLGYHAFGKG